MREKQRNTQKGITLIALIITIIVMLILVAVTITIAVNGGLFEQAGRATKETQNAINAEQQLANGGITIGNLHYDSIEDYLEGIPEIHNWTRTGDNLTCKHCNTNLTIGQQLNYTKTGAGTSSISGEKSGVSQGITDGRLQASNFEENGEQKINKDDDTKWVVLGIEDSNKNGTNETLLLTTAKPTTDEIILDGAAAYNNCIDEINRMCKEIYGEEARGMTIEDVNNCLEYIPVGGMYFLNKWNTTGNLTTKLKDLGEMWTAIKDYNNTNSESGMFYDPANPDGIADNGKTLGEYPLDGYSYELSNDGTYLINRINTADTSNTITTATKNVIFGSNKEYHYWLASRGVGTDSICAHFGPGSVYEGGAHSYDMLLYSRGVSDSDEFSCRAVVSLRSDIPAV